MDDRAAMFDIAVDAHQSRFAVADRRTLEQRERLRHDLFANFAPHLEQLRQVSLETSSEWIREYRQCSHPADWRASLSE